MTHEALIEEIEDTMRGRQGTPTLNV